MFAATPYLSAAQNFEIEGEVRDSLSHQPIEYASIYLHGTSAGANTDANGHFAISSPKLGDSLFISSVGYAAMHIVLNKNNIHSLHIELAPRISELSAVSIVADKDPGAKFMKKVIEHKRLNDPAYAPSYTYRSYLREELDINNINYSVGKKSKLLQDWLDKLKKIDSGTSGAQLPVYFIEVLSEKEHSPKGNEAILPKEHVLARKTLGLSTDKAFRQLDRFSLNVSIYDNWIPIFYKTFVSPVSDNALGYYKYYIKDSSLQNGHKVYNLQFVPLKHENAFRGYLQIEDSTYAVTGFQMSLSKDANLNFIDALSVSGSFQPSPQKTLPPFLPAGTTSSVRFQSGPSLIGLPIPDKSASINATLTTKYVFSNKVDTAGLPASVISSNMESGNTFGHNNESYLISHRLDTLSTHEKDIYNVIDTLNTDKRFQLATKFAALVGTGFWDFGDKWRIGPYSSLVSLNRIEGVRTRCGFWSLPGMYQRWNFNGYLAYGTKDQRFKGGIGIKYLHSMKRWSKTSISVRSDYDLIINYDDELDNDNIISSVLNKNIPIYRSYINEYKLQHEEELLPNLTMQLSLAYKEFNPAFGFEYLNVDDDVKTVPGLAHKLPVTEFNTTIRYAPGQKYIVLNYDRISLYNTHPIFTLSYTYGFELINSEFIYHKIDASIAQNLKLPPKATFYYRLAGGRTFGTLPYLLLDVPNGNQYYVASKYSFNTMAPYEFISDKYISLNTRLSLGGMLLDHIPYMQKLQWRERFSFNAFMGGLSDANRVFNANSRTYTTGNVPFAEVSAGIENIFHAVSIEYYWRLTHLNDKYAIPRGLFIGVNLNF